MNAPMRAPTNAGEWSVRAGQRRKPPDRPPDKHRAGPQATDQPHVYVQTAQDAINIASSHAAIKRLIRLRAQIRAGDAPLTAYAEHNRLVDSLRPQEPRGWSENRQVLTTAQRAARWRNQRFEPSSTILPALFDPVAPYRAAAERHIRILKRREVYGPVTVSEHSELTDLEPSANLPKVRQSAAAEMLQPGQDRELARKYRETGDQTALDRLVAAHIRLARKLAYRIKTIDVDRDDLVAIATEAMVRAAKTYDPDKGFAFATYGGRSAWYALLDTTKYRDDAYGNKALRHSLNEPISEDGCEFIELLAADGPDDDIWDEDRYRLRKILHVLSPRERQLLRFRYGGDEVLTLDEVAQRMGGISRERVRQIEHRAFNKLWGAAQ